MKLYLGLFNGKLIVLNLRSLKLNRSFNLILNSKICPGIIEPIVNIDNKLILLGIEKKFIKIFSHKNQKNLFKIECPDKKFSHLFSFQPPSNLFFSCFKNYIYIWKKKNEKNWKIINKIISRSKIDYISNITKSNLMITTDKNSYDINFWKIFNTKLFFCGKTIIKEKISRIEGSPYKELFSICNNIGIIKTYTNNGIIINKLFEKKECGHSFNIFTQNSLKFYDYNNLLTGGTSKNLSLWDLRINKIVQQWKGHTGEIKEIEINSSKLNFFQPLMISYDRYGIVKTWDLRMNSEFHSFKIYSGKISCMKLV